MSTYENDTPVPGDLARQEQQRKQPDEAKSLIIAGYLTAVFLPLAGFIIGIVLMAKNKYAHGAAALVLSIFMVFFWMGFAKGFNQAQTTYQGGTCDVTVEYC